MPEEYSKDARDDAKLVMDFIHRHMMHHAMWFREVYEKLGKERAYKLLNEVYEKSMAQQLGRLSKTLGFELVDGIPEPLLKLTGDQRKAIKESMGINWLAMDGI